MVTFRPDFLLAFDLSNGPESRYHRHHFVIVGPEFSVLLCKLCIKALDSLFESLKFPSCVKIFSFKKFGASLGSYGAGSGWHDEAVPELTSRYE